MCESSTLFFELRTARETPVVVKAALAGTCFHFHQQVRAVSAKNRILFHIELHITKFLFVSWQVSYSLLARVSPVTHSVTNSLKRVVVIVSSVLFFRTPLSPINSLGMSHLN